MNSQIPSPCPPPTGGGGKGWGSVESLVGQVADEFTERLNRGEHPDIEEYAGRYPEIAHILRQALPALQAVGSLVPGSIPSDEAALGQSLLEGCLGDFRIIRQIGRGGMGVVYEAEQVSLARRVALKVLPFAAALDSKQLQRFKNEAHAAANLQHQNIVPVYFVGCERGVHFYAMQFVEGQTLAALIQELRHLEGREGEAGTPAYRAEPRPLGSGAAEGLEKEARQEPRPPEDLASELVSGRWAGAMLSPGHPSTDLSSSDAEARRKHAIPCTTRPYIPPTPVDQTPQAMTTTPPVGARSTEHSTSRPAFFRTVANLGIQAAEALEHAHQLGVIHRDIKPANLMVDARGNLWITDFGLAHCQGATELTMSGDLLGTLRYMSPEQALAKRVIVDERTDVYSLGATLYELLTLEPAFPGSDRQEVLRQIAFDDPKLLRRLNKAIPVELETIVLKAMEKNPTDRYATAKELVDDLHQFLDDRPIRARRPTLVQRLRKLARRHPGVLRTGVGALLLAVLILAVSIGLILQQLHRVEQAEQAKSEELWRAKLAQAQAGRWSGRAGRRFESLQALREAAQIARSLDLAEEDILRLRNEAIACMALTDLRRITELDRYTSGSPGAALDPRLQRYTTSDERGNISVHRMGDDQVIVRLKGPGIAVSSLAFSRDGQYLAGTYYFEPQGKRGRILVWDLPRGETVYQVALEFSGRPLVWSPDSRQLAIHWQTDTIIIHDVVAHREIQRLSAPAEPTHFVFHPNGKQLAISTPPTVQIRDLETGNLAGQFAFPIPVTRLAWGADGRFLAGICTEPAPIPDGYYVFVWDVPAGRIHTVLKGHYNTVIDIAFNQAGDLLASTSWDGTYRLWNPWTGQELVRDVGSWGRPLEFSSDDRFLSVGVEMSKARRWWEVQTGREYYRIIYDSGGILGSFGNVGFSPAGRMLAFGCLKGFRLWDLAAFKELALLPAGSGGAVIFDRNGKSLVTGGPDRVYAWPFSLDQEEDGRKLQMGPPEKLDLGNSKILTRAERMRAAGYEGRELSPDGRWAATRSWHGNGAKLWDALTGKLVLHLTTDDAHVIFSPDGK